MIDLLALLNPQFIDLFLIRKTRQAELEVLIEFDEHRQITNPFFQDQIGIAEQMINQIQPRLIVVINKKASDIINQVWNNEITPFDDEVGDYSYRIAEDRLIPIFFSGMVSGQRALDIYSRQRPIWHMNRAVE